MRLRRPATLAAVVLGALSLAAASCDRTLGPAGAEAGTYVAVSAAGAPLPFTFYQSPEETFVLRADTITLDGHGHATRATTVEHLWGGQDLTPPTSRTSPDYRIDGEAFEIGWFSPCPPNALCVRPESGSLRGDELTLRTWGEDGEVQYLRVRD
jgi:hypothetical protein